MSFLGLSSHSAFILNAPAGCAAFPIALGLNAILRPQSALDMWGFKVDASPRPSRDTALIHSLIRLYGVRNIAMGSSMLAVWKFGDNRTLGWVVLAVSFVAVGDGFVQKSYSGDGEWKHWGFVPLGIGMAAALFGYF